MVVVGKHFYFCLLWLSGTPHLTAKIYFFAPLPMSTKFGNEFGSLKHRLFGPLKGVPFGLMFRVGKFIFWEPTKGNEFGSREPGFGADFPDMFFSELRGADDFRGAGAQGFDTAGLRLGCGSI